MKSGSKLIDGIIKRDKELFFTTTREPYPFIAERGEGDFAYDITGRKFIDFTSFVSIYNLGVNANKQIRDAIKKQIDKIMHVAFTDNYALLPVEFGEQLLKFMPEGFGRMFLSNSGTEANEAAIKFAKIFTRRQYILAYYNSFHGRSMGALQLTSSKLVQRQHFGPFPNAIHTPYPYCYRCPFKQTYPECGFACIDYMKRYALGKEADGSEIAAIALEPIQGEGGYIVPPKDYFKEIKKIADSYNMLIIDDEIQAGYMRTGKFLALDNFGITADIYTMAKAIGSGLPLGVTIARKSLGDIPAGSHATTFGGNLASVAGALEALRYIEKNKKHLEEAIARKGRKIMNRIKEIAEDEEIIGDIRGMGMMIGIELVKSREGKEPAIKEREGILQYAFKKGLLLLPAGESTIRIIPPFTISEESLDEGLDVLEEAIKKGKGA
ncbi:MAG: aminotransferase class III-fold pyridoxal phosphate-dependent enzyme [Candidatus Micrarchaeaceae archaeon]